ncbi:MAG TPA: hypothetical protein EYQ27_15230 [Gemmatimonadetes bacterium]|nr:hypothetical protein [Gemmatimonadota bacterium]
MLLVLQEDIDRQFPEPILCGSPDYLPDDLRPTPGWYLHMDDGATYSDLWATDWEGWSLEQLHARAPLSPRTVGPFQSQLDCLLLLNDWAGEGTP